MKEIVKGIIASSGYAIGKAVYHETEDLSALNAEIKIAEPDEDIKKFDNAVSVCRQELQEIIVKMESEVNKNEASIFSAHMLILEDPMFYDEVKNTINSEKIDSVSAISKTTQKIAEEFKEIKDDYIKERIQDIKDVASRLVRIYRGKSNISSDMGFSYILVTDELYPSKMADLNKKEILGIITKRGGINSHAAIISRALGIPSIVGLKYDLSLLNDKKLIIDAVKGDVIIEPDGSDIQKYGKIIENNRLKEEQLKAFSDKETYTKDGQKIILCLNANSPD